MATVAPLIVITGPTASGKSGLALKLAKKYGGEIICADSRTVYKEMNIGTAKPSHKDTLFVPHHLLDIVRPDERFTAADFQRLAKEKIEDIRRRGNVPFLVGGTGLYIDSVTLDYEFNGPVDGQKRKLLEEKSVEELTSLIKEQRLKLPTNMLNKRHLVRTLEQNGTKLRRKNVPDSDTCIVSIATEKEELFRRVRARADEMFAANVLDEARVLGAKYGWECEALSGNIYPILRQVIEQGLSEADAKERFIVSDRQLIKKQLTWLRRHSYVQWCSLDEAEREISATLDRWSAQDVLV